MIPKALYTIYYFDKLYVNKKEEQEVVQDM